MSQKCCNTRQLHHKCLPLQAYQIVRNIHEYLVNIITLFAFFGAFIQGDVNKCRSSMIMNGLTLQGVSEVHYLHRRWPRARALTKLRGTALTALAWPPEGSATHSDTCTGCGQGGGVLCKPSQPWLGLPEGSATHSGTCTGCGQEGGGLAL